MSLTEKETDVIIDGFEKVKMRLEKTTNEQADLKNSVSLLQKSLQAYRKMGLSGQAEAGPEHNHFWANEGMAKEFGELILQCVGRGQKAMGEVFGEGGALVPIEMST